MGEYAEMILEGSACDICGEYMGEATGFPQRCNGCHDEITKLEVEQKSENHYFTFGTAHDLADFHQVIKASDPDEARDEMVRLHGWDWAFQYAESEWNDSLAKGFFKNNMPLKTTEEES